MNELKRASKEFKNRFIAEITKIPCGRRFCSHKEAARAYYNYLESVGETSDGTPEDDANYWADHGGA